MNSSICKNYKSILLCCYRYSFYYGRFITPVPLPFTFLQQKLISSLFMITRSTDSSLDLAEQSIYPLSREECRIILSHYRCRVSPSTPCLCSSQPSKTIFTSARGDLPTSNTIATIVSMLRLELVGTWITFQITGNGRRSQYYVVLKRWAQASLFCREDKT